MQHALILKQWYSSVQVSKSTEEAQSHQKCLLLDIDLNGKEVDTASVQLPSKDLALLTCAVALNLDGTAGAVKRPGIANLYCCADS
jgi:hypothetical protein